MTNTDPASSTAALTDALAACEDAHHLVMLDALDDQLTADPDDAGVRLVRAVLIDVIAARHATVAAALAAWEDDLDSDLTVADVTRDALAEVLA